MRATAMWRNTAWMKNAELLEADSGAEAAILEYGSCRTASVAGAEFDRRRRVSEDSDAKTMRSMRSTADADGSLPAQVEFEGA